MIIVAVRLSRIELRKKVTPPICNKRILAVLFQYSKSKNVEISTTSSRVSSK